MARCSHEWWQHLHNLSEVCVSIVMNVRWNFAHHLVLPLKTLKKRCRWLLFGGCGISTSEVCVATWLRRCGHCCWRLLAMKPSLTIFWSESGETALGWVWTVKRVDCKWSHRKFGLPLRWDVSAISWHAATSHSTRPFKPVVLSVTCIGCATPLSDPAMEYIPRTGSTHATKQWRCSSIPCGGWLASWWHIGGQKGTSGDTSGRRQGTRQY